MIKKYKNINIDTDKKYVVDDSGKFLRFLSPQELSEMSTKDLKKFLGEGSDE